ncbi:MAG: pyruvate dehydrogenase complex E1 component subunit beta [Micropepsaceae bacterium]
MPTEILMPALSPTMEEGKLAKWHVKEGDRVSSGDVIAEIETDKATMEVEAVDEGVVTQLLVAEGTEGVKVNAPIAVLRGDDEKSSAPASAPTAKVVQAPTPVAKATVVAPVVPTTVEASTAGREMHTITVREALREAMAEEMRRDPNVFLMGEEVGQYQGAYKISQGLLDEFGPTRVIDTPITEQGFAGLGVGAAFGGLRPIVEFMTWNFAMQAIDQIINSAGKTLYMSGGQMGCPIVFRGPNGAAARVGAQHSQSYGSWYAHVPGLRVVAPYFAADAKGLLKAAIRDPNPVVFLENEICYGRSFEVPVGDDHVVPIGKARVVREGTDVTLVAYSITVGMALQAIDILSKEGISVELIDLRSLRPLDTETVIASVKKTNRILTVEESWPVCGIASEISTQVVEQAFDYLDAPPARVTGKDVPMPYAANLEKLALPSVDEIVAAVKAVCYRA